MFLVIGVMAGPVITNAAGWQVTVNQVQNQVRAELVEQQALYCADKARIEIPGTIILSYADGDSLAKRWAIKPGETAIDRDVVRACARKLAN